MLSDRPARPGTGYFVSIALFGVLTVAAALTSIALTTVDAERRSFPNTVITDVDTLAATAGIILAVLVCSYLIQARLLDRIDMHANRIADGVQTVSEDVELLRDDTGQIPRLANAVVDAPEIIIVHHGPREYQYMDREAAMAVLQQAAQPEPVELPEDLMRRISRRSYELGRRMGRNEGNDGDGPAAT